MQARRQRARKRREVGLDLPVGWHALARRRAEAIEVLLQVACCPQFVEGGIEVGREQGSAADLAVAVDRVDQLLGHDALGFGIALAAGSGSEARSRMRRGWGGRQHAHGSAGGVVQVGAQAAGA
jgi:hypothetical protein